MSITTVDTAPYGDTPENLRDHAIGRADAYDAHHAGTPLTVLADRLEWMDDPRISHYTAAYLDGYRAYLSDMAADQWWTTRIQAAVAFDNHGTKAVTA